MGGGGGSRYARSRSEPDPPQTPHIPPAPPGTRRDSSLSAPLANFAPRWVTRNPGEESNVAFQKTSDESRLLLPGGDQALPSHFAAAEARHTRYSHPWGSGWDGINPSSPFRAMIGNRFPSLGRSWVGVRGLLSGPERETETAITGSNRLATGRACLCGFGTVTLGAGAYKPKAGVLASGVVGGPGGEVSLSLPVWPPYRPLLGRRRRDQKRASRSRVGRVLGGLLVARIPASPRKGGALPSEDTRANRSWVPFVVVGGFHRSRDTFSLR